MSESRSWEDVYRTQTAEIDRLCAELAECQGKAREAEFFGKSAAVQRDEAQASLAAARERSEELAAKYKWQVRDTCKRAEAAESELAICRRERDFLSSQIHLLRETSRAQAVKRLEAERRAESAESKLAAIRAMQVPEKPTYWIVDFERGIVRHAWNAEFGDYVTRDDYKAIRAFAEAVQAKAGEE